MSHPLPHPPSRIDGIGVPVEEPSSPAWGPGMVITGLAALAYMAFFGWYSLRRYWAYEMHALDMGNMGQAAWNTLHGHPFYFTNMRLMYNIEAWFTTTRLSFHVEALFPAISLVYLVYPHPESLIVLQTVALGLGAVPVLLLARDLLRSDLLATSFALAYLLFPALESMNLYEFHPVALATPLLLAAFLFVWRRQYGRFALCALAAIGTKEEIGLTVALIGLYIAFVRRDRLVGAVTVLVGAGWSAFAVLVIEKHYRLPGSVSYLHTRYKYLGHGLHGALNTLLHNPGVFPATVFTWPKLDYVAHLLSPEGFLAFLAAPALVFAVPTLILNLFSLDIHMYSGLGQDSAEIIAVVTVASICGARVLLALLGPVLSRRRLSPALAVYVLAVAFWTQHLNGFTPLGARFYIPSIGAHQRLADQFVGMVPAGAPVATQDQLDPHLSSRHYLYLFEDTGRQPLLAPAQYILLDVSAPTYPLPSYQLHDAALSYVRKSGWGVAAAQDGLILLQHGAGRKSIPRAFYTYMDGSRMHPQRPLRYAARGVRLTGVTVTPIDTVHDPVPPLLLTFTARAESAHPANLRTVVFETVGSHLAGCAQFPLGLAWETTNSWKPGFTYLIRQEPLQTNWQSPGMARLFAELLPVMKDRKAPLPSQFSCDELWASHGALVYVGSRSVSF